MSSLCYSLRFAIAITALLAFVSTADLPAQSILGGRFEWLSPSLSLESFWTSRTVGNRIELYGNSLLMVSTDGGLTWRREERDSLSLALSVWASWIDGQNGFSLLGIHSIDPARDVYRTSDGGANWTKIATLDAGDRPRQIAFTDALHGWIVGEKGLLLKSSDGGVTWTRQAKITPGDFYSSHLYPIGNDRIVLAMPLNHTPGGKIAGVFHSDDGGATWDTVSIGSAAGGGQAPPVLSIVKLDAQTLLAVTTAPHLYKSIDGGASWTRKPTGIPDKIDNAREAQMGSFHFVDDKHGWAIGTNDELFRTTDGAESWTLLDTGKAPIVIQGPFGPTTISAASLFGYRAFDAQNLLLYGSSGQVKRSTDGGVTWTSMSSAVTTQYLSSAAFATANTGWIGGARGTLLRTSDGGVTWTPQSFGGTESIGELAAVDEATAWGVISPNILIRTTDGGATWQRTAVAEMRLDTLHVSDPPIITGFRALSFSDRLHGWAAGVKGTIIATDDGGATWRRLAPLVDGNGGTYTYDINAVQLLDGENGWAVGNSGAIFSTSDGGTSWRYHETGDGNTYSFRDLSFTDAAHGVVVGDRGRVYVTSDGGESWDRGESTTMDGWTFSAYRGVARGKANELFAVGIGNSDEYGTSGIVARSVDGGLTWSEPHLLLSYGLGYLNGIFFPTAETGYMVGSRGAIVKYTATPSSVRGEASISGVSARVHPNPMSGNGTLVLEMPRAAHARLTLIDALGRELATLADRMLPAGAVAIEIDLAPHPVGAYFIHVVVDGRVSALPVVVGR